jgi:hypothetical protein
MGSAGTGMVLRISDLLTTMTHYRGVMVLHGLRVMTMSKAQQAMQRAQTTSIIIWALGIFTHLSFLFFLLTT